MIPEARSWATVIAGGDFPALADAIASGALEDEDDPDSEFEFGLAADPALIR
jgi:hypothetical protein